MKEFICLYIKSCPKGEKRRTNTRACHYWGSVCLYVMFILRFNISSSWQTEDSMAMSNASGGAKVLGKLPVPGRPTNLVYSRARAYCACSECGWG